MHAAGAEAVSRVPRHAMACAGAGLTVGAAATDRG